MLKEKFPSFHHMNRILGNQEIVNYYMKMELTMFGEHRVKAALMQHKHVVW